MSDGIVSPWQRMNTAPKEEGARILVYCESRPLVYAKDGSVVQYTKSGVYLAMLVKWNGTRVWCKDEVYSPGGHPEPLEPSRWVPLPTIPAKISPTPAVSTIECEHDWVTVGGTQGGTITGQRCRKCYKQEWF